MLPLKEFTRQLTQKAEGGLGNIVGQRVEGHELDIATVQVFQQVAFIVFSS
jgi:hypothetical protein